MKSEQAMLCCRQSIRHYLDKCCPNSMAPYGVTKLLWINSDLCRHLSLLGHNELIYDVDKNFIHITSWGVIAHL